MDYENTVRNLKPTVTWKVLQSADPEISDFKAHEGFMTVPSNYSSPSSHEVALYCQRFTNKSTTIPKVHMIFLAGGPGGTGKTVRWQATHYLEVLPELELATYIIDHRGLGRSSPFIGEDAQWSKISKNLANIIDKGPFPVKDLTLKNAALDNGYLAIAIKSDPEFPADGKLIVFGGSYGATLAHQTVKLFPNLFYSGIFKLTPGLATATRSFRGLAESCALDEYCRNKVGGNVYEELKKAVRRVAGITTNDCTFILSLFLDEKYSKVDYKHRVIMLSMLMQPLLLDEGDEFEVNSSRIRHTQLIIPFLKATSDCPDPAKYTEQVLNPMAPHLNHLVTSLQKKLATDEHDVNSFVNSVVFYDLDSARERPNISDDIDDFDSDLSFITDYGMRFKSMQPYLSGMEITDRSPLQTSTTKIYMMHRRMDLVTSYPSAYEIYTKISAPVKHWLLLDNSGHSGDYGECTFELSHDAIDDNRLADLTDCMEVKNKREALDWSFNGNQKLTDMWNHVVPASKPVPIHQQLSGAPSFDKITTDATGTKRSIRDSSSFYKFVMYNPYFIIGMVILVISLIAGIFYYLSVRNKRRQSDLEKDLDASINTDKDENAETDADTGLETDANTDLEVDVV